MAQIKLDSFFQKKKQNVGNQASKRRKIEIIGTTDGKEIINDSKLTKLLPAITNFSNKKPKEVQDQLVVGETFSETVCTTQKLSLNFSSQSLCATKRSTSIRNKTSRVKSEKKSTVKTKKQQTKVSDLFQTGCCKSKTPASQSANIEERSDNIASVFNEKVTSPKLTVTEEITSLWDDQVEKMCNTPRKRLLPDIPFENEECVSQRKKAHAKKRPTPDDHISNTVQLDKYTSAKKKLELIKDETVPKDDSDREVASTMSRKSDLCNLLSMIPIPPDKVSPLPSSPFEELASDKQQDIAVNPKTPDVPKLAIDLKKLTKMKSEAVKNQLKLSGKMPQLKEKLGELKNLMSKKKESAIVSHDVEVEAQEKTSEETSIPAHQRFEYLAEAGPPTLTLPYTYKTLDSLFQSVEQVVSMLHNRSEICTFSKLQASVQNITRKNFEVKTIGQIKTVVPEAYTYRQEKNIPQYGKQNSNYQMTIEANLEVDGSSKDKKQGQFTAEGKPMFSASLLLKRQRQFKNNLLDYLKQHHKKFLASLKIPLNVPDEKLTRWHPLFQLDKVPEVTPAELPQPPEEKIYQTAKDVLERQRGKLNPMVVKALSKVVTENKQEDASNKTKTMNCENTSSNTGSQNIGTIKGIPPALLAKIRAKEAQRMEDALTRKPDEDIKIRIMNRLPEIIRTLRALFITEKKIALPLEQVYKKIEDNYKNGISQRDVEQHVSMLKELAPELISIVEIKRGKFMKLDKNVDIQATISKILNLIKTKG